jgi:hypothetical protein
MKINEEKLLIIDFWFITGFSLFFLLYTFTTIFFDIGNLFTAKIFITLIFFFVFYNFIKGVMGCILFRRLFSKGKILKTKKVWLYLFHALSIIVWIYILYIFFYRLDISDLYTPLKIFGISLSTYYNIFLIINIITNIAGIYTWLFYFSFSKYQFKKTMKIILNIITPINILFINFVLVLSNVNDSYYVNKIVFMNEIEKDSRIKGLLYLERPKVRDENEFDAVFELTDGKIIGGVIKDSIYYFFNLKVIDNYNINTLLLSYYHEFSKWDSYYYSGFNSTALEEMLNKPDSFKFDLNDYINYYDEIKELVEKIYYEGPIPGKYESEKWENAEQFKNYTGYIEYKEWLDEAARGDDLLAIDRKIIIYVEYAEKDYDFYSNKYFFK